MVWLIFYNFRPVICCKARSKSGFANIFNLSCIIYGYRLHILFSSGKLKNVFPKDYLKSIGPILNGLVDKAMTKFKLRIPITNIVAGAKAQQLRQSYFKISNEINNGGINILENIFLDSFRIYKMPNYPQYGNQGKKEAIDKVLQ